MNTSLDRVIDDVARDFTAGEPCTDFRAHVLDRVSAAKRTSAPIAGSWALRTAAAAAAIATVAAGITLWRAPHEASPVPRISSASGAGPSTTPMADARSDATPIAPRAAARRPGAPQVSPGLSAWRDRAIPALAGIEPIGVGDIQPAGLSVSQLSVTPLDIAPMVVEPIGDGGR